MDRSVLIWVGLIDSVVAVVAPLLDVFHDSIGVPSGSVILACGVGLIAVVTFVGFTMAGGSADLKDVMREAIAAAFVVVFLVVVAMTTFFTLISTDQAAKQSLATLTSQILPAFKDLTTVVIGFYFGAAAVVKVADALSTAKTTGDAAKAEVAKADTANAEAAKAEAEAKIAALGART